MVAIFKSVLAITLAVASMTMAAPIDARSDPTVQTADTPNTEIFASDIKYTGKGTWFTDSYGSCNINWNGEKEPIVALSATLMGSSSWGNPSCDRKVKITSGGKSVTARVVDKCPSAECARGSLDLSPAAFRQLANQDVGIIDIKWNFI